MLDLLLEEIRTSTALQQECLNLLTNELDYSYLRYKTESSIKDSQLKSIINSAIGAIKVQPTKAANEISYEMFMKHYTFGKYLNVREWIPHLKVCTGKLLTREALFEYVLRNAKTKKFRGDPDFQLAKY